METVIIRSLAGHTINDTGKGNYQPVDLSHDCCDMTIEPLASGNMNVELSVDRNHLTMKSIK
jgi:hypothetical protein